MTQVLGVIVIARNGDRLEYYQDPTDYEATFTAATPLGEVSANCIVCSCSKTQNFTGPIPCARFPAAIPVP